MERLVRALGVELLDEAVEADLLLEAVHAGRPGGLPLQRQMHALVTAVLLRMARLDALDVNAEAQPLEIGKGQWAASPSLNSRSHTPASRRPPWRERAAVSPPRPVQVSESGELLSID